MSEKNPIEKPLKIGAVVIVVAVVFAVTWQLAFAPLWNVWQSELKGKAELAQATFNRQIAVQEAEAKKESAKSLADAEVIRAQGVATANAIIGDSLKDNEEYLRYLWIDSLRSKEHQIIYVPTESNLPILEADRFGQPPQ